MDHLDKLREYQYLFDSIIVKALLGVVGLFALAVIAHKVLIRQRPDEPPIVKGWIPWYGNYFDMDRNPEKLLTKLRKKYGDIFSVWTAGQKMTIVLDILEGIPGMYRNTKQMEFHEFERQLQAPVFGFPLDFRDNLELQGELHDLISDRNRRVVGSRIEEARHRWLRHRYDRLGSLLYVYSISQVVVRSPFPRTRGSDVQRFLGLGMGFREHVQGKASLYGQERMGCTRENLQTYC